DFAVGFRGALARRVGGFEDEDGAAVAHDEAVALLIERPRRLFWGVVALAEGAKLGKAGHRIRTHGDFERAGQADVDDALANPIAADRQGRIAAGAGRGDAGAGAFEPEKLTPQRREAFAIPMRFKDAVAATQ